MKRQFRVKRKAIPTAGVVDLSSIRGYSHKPTKRDIIRSQMLSDRAERNWQNFYAREAQ